MPNVSESVGERASVVPEPRIDRPRVAAFEPLDDHKEHSRFLKEQIGLELSAPSQYTLADQPMPTSAER